MKKERNSALLRSTCPTRPSSSPIIPILPHPFFTDLSPLTFQLPPPLNTLCAYPIYNTSHRQFILVKTLLFTHPNLNLNPYLWICCPLSYPLGHANKRCKLTSYLCKITEFSTQSLSAWCMCI